MKIVTFDSDEEWHHWRAQGIGGSDIGVIMEANPYKTPYQLWEEKCGYRGPSPINIHMEHGIKLEPVARDWLNQTEGLHLAPIYIEDKSNPIFRASLDGFDYLTQTICEIKAPTTVHTLDLARSNLAVPDHWWHQMQWNLMISEANRGIFALWDYRYNNCITIEMFGHPSLWDLMRNKAAVFWHQVKSGTAPPLSSKDYIEIEDIELQILLKEYEQACDKEKEAQGEKDRLKKKIIEFGDDGNFKAYGFCIRRVTPKVSYDLNQMKLDGIDVERYAKKSKDIGGYMIIPPRKKNDKT